MTTQGRNDMLNFEAGTAMVVDLSSLAAFILPRSARK
jgi:hypothetical protein